MAEVLGDLTRTHYCGALRELVLAQDGHVSGAQLVGAFHLRLEPAPLVVHQHRDARAAQLALQGQGVVERTGGQRQQEHLAARLFG